MTKTKFFNILASGENIYPISIHKQYWSDERFNGNSVRPRPDFGIVLIRSGTAEFVSEIGTLTATPGNVVLLPKGCLYETVFRGKTHDYVVSFEIDNSEPIGSSPILLFENAPNELRDAFRALVHEKYSAGHTELKSKGLLYLFLNSLFDNSEPTDNLILTVKSRIDSDPNIPISVLAKECAICESSLRRIFKKHTGITPAEYRTEVKLRRAMYLLESADKSVAEIAEELGFYDAAYFSKTFHKHVGLTPKQYAGKRII